MKRIHLTLVLAVFCVAAFASAAVAGPVGTMEINAGYVKSSTNVGTSSESMGGGIGFGAAYWRSATPTVQWGAEVSYDNLGNAEAPYVDPLTLATYSEKFSSKVFRINPAVRMNFGSMVGPSFFVQGGAGLYNVSWNDESTDPSISPIKDSSSKVGFNLGAGMGFPVGPKTKMNVTASYHLVSKVEYQGSNVMDNMNNLQVRAGVGFGL